MGDILQLAGPAETVGSSGNLSLATVAEILVYMKKTSGADDALLQTLLDSVAVAAFGFMQGRFLKRSSTPFDVVFTPRGEGDVIWLTQWPIGTVTSVQTGGMDQNGQFNPDHTYEATEWYSDVKAGRIYGSFPAGTKHSVRVVWTGGYAAVPQDAKEAAMMWAAVKYQRANDARWDQTSMQSATQGYSYGEEMPRFSQDIFAKYRSFGRWGPS